VADVGKKEGKQTKTCSRPLSHTFPPPFLRRQAASMVSASLLRPAAGVARPAAAAPAVAARPAASSALPCALSTSGRREAAAAAVSGVDRRHHSHRRYIAVWANVSTADDDDAPPLSPDELRGAAVAGAQTLERSIGESSVDYLSVSELVFCALDSLFVSSSYLLNLSTTSSSTSSPPRPHKKKL